MSFAGLMRGAMGRAERIFGTVIVLIVLALAVLVPTTVIAVEETSQPEFCNSCHIMEPYYESWASSSHNNVNCIECHYEPGALETVRGKFQALSQLAKYVTRTQGTKPWAEVSDQSCMRSGCHSVRLLEGQIEFGRIKFDHRHHLLESRRGRRLRCTSCHSQIVQGDHLKVTESVCFMCHFKPGGDPEELARTSDCLECHGPPDHVIEVAGAPFDHQEYLGRGVGCRECHDPVVQGDGAVRRERCNQCHGEVGHIERFGETEFLHEQHVTKHKVECFECHEEIEHGLLPLKSPEPASSEGCGACHVDSHDASRMLYAGTGAIGVDDRPSRMYETRVVCDACHTGRSGMQEQRPGAGAPVPAAAHAGRDAAHGTLGSRVAKAGPVDCIHCHGTGFDGMLERWQSIVGGELERLAPMLEELDAEVPSFPSDPARRLVEEARRNVLLVELDGSRGAHNVVYALGALRAGAERLDRARTLVDPESVPSATAGLPFLSANGCSECHLGVERGPAPVVNGSPFPHDRHLAAGLDCQTCHSVTDHGRPAFPRSECASCHHTENEDFDVEDCAACHEAQSGLLAGNVPGFPEEPAAMADLECNECHGDPPDLMRPRPAICVLCHEAGFDTIMGQWQGTVREQEERLNVLRTRLQDPVHAAGADARTAFAEAERELGLVLADGSQGVHNVHLTLDVLRSAGEKLDRVAQAVGLDGAGELPEPPLETDEGCSTCHVGFERSPALLPDGSQFPHRRHVADAGLACSTCHLLKEHGRPAFPRNECASCHHQENEAFDAWECGDCHQRQESLLSGEVPGFESVEGPKADLDCTDCHGEPPDVGPPNMALCKLCHGDEVEETVAGWKKTYDELHGRLVERIERAGDDTAAVSRERAALELLDGDGSRGIHNSPMARELLEQ